MATITVTTALDVVDAGDGALSLREAVAQANATTAADTIVFAAGLETQTLTLTGGELVIGRDLTIDGDRNNDGLEVVLSGGDNQRLLRTSGAGTDLTLQDLTMVDGHVGYGANGGGIFAGGGTSVTLNGSTLESCVAADGSGGGIFAESGSRLNVIGSTLRGNGAPYGNGGAIFGEQLAEVTIRHGTISHNGTGYYGAGGAISAWMLTIEDSIISDNAASHYGIGGAIEIIEGSATILRTSITSNNALRGGAIAAYASDVMLQNVTVAGNLAYGSYYTGFGGGIIAAGNSRVTLVETTVTGNRATNDAYRGSDESPVRGGGINITDGTELTLINSIVSGNSVSDDSGVPTAGPDIFGMITSSNGHNIFGSDVAGNLSGDRENVAPSSLFAALDPDTGGGLLSATGIVPLRNAVTNPALSGADPLAASDTGQLGGTGRPLPAGSLPDIGAIEISQALSKTASANNDVLTGTAKANTIDGKAGADFIKGLAGNDTLRGGDGGDVLDGGTGNDKLYGDAGIDLVFYGGSTKVKVDLSLATDKATRGSETDTLYNVEGAIGSSAADTFKGNEYNNYFQGGLGKDTATGGAGRDTYDFNAVAESKAGVSRDVITDFAHLVDRIDLMGIDANTTVAGNQTFLWVGRDGLSGPGEVGFFTSGGNTIIRASTDADAASELEIQLTGIKVLSAADFYF